MDCFINVKKIELQKITSQLVGTWIWTFKATGYADTTVTQDEIDSLGKFEEFEGVTIVLPNPNTYIKLLKLTSEEYSVEKGNPLSDFFISSVVTQGSTIVGYLVGQYVNQKEDIKLYTVKSNEIANFLDENPILKETGFINARLGSRFNKNNNETTYFLKSCLNNLSFRDIPNLISKIEDTEKFF